VRNYGALSFAEYEKLVGDLFGEVLGMRFERFGAGRDQGIDLRHVADGGGPDVIQVKHYLRSTWSDLQTAAREERRRLGRLDPAPGTYRFVTSQSLTPARKDTLVDLLKPFVARADAVFGGEEVDDLLDRHEAVERRHSKLWLASAAGLRAITQSNVHARSRQLAAEIEQKLPLWVQGDVFFEASERLSNERVLVISGQPGIGKTTLAEILVAEAIGEGYEAIAIGADIEEGWAALDASAPQIFLYDDFLGQTSLVELSKNEDSRLVSFMREIAAAKDKFFVLTTREYILQRALQVSETLRRHGLSAARVLLTLPSYSSLDRARILANHVWHSPTLPLEVRMELAEARGYRRIVEHPNYNPRLIEFVTGHQAAHQLEVGPNRTWLDAAVDALDHPDEIWRAAYEGQLGNVERGLVLVLATFERQAQLDDLRRAHDSWCSAAGIGDSPRRFDGALEVVDDSFVVTGLDDGEYVVAFANPGVRDYIDRQLLEDPSAFSAVLQSIVFFEQLRALWQLVRDQQDVPLREALIASIPAIAARTYEADSATWITHVSWNGQRILKRWNLMPDARLGTMIDIARATEAPAELKDWISARLRERVGAWANASGHAGEALALGERLQEADEIEVPDGWREALKVLVTADPSGPQEWRDVLELRELAPDLFPDDEWTELGLEFLRSAESYLSDNADNIESRDEIDSMSIVADEFGVELDSGWVQTAEDAIGDKLAQEDARQEMEYETWREERHLGATPGPADEMDQLFDRLADA
jgi:DNA polymerase III delta prime subunit